MQKLNSPWLRKPLMRATLLSLSCVSLMAFGGCLTIRPTLTSGTDPACLAIKVVRYSHSDTADTVDQVRANNAALAILCPAQNPAPK